MKTWLWIAATALVAGCSGDALDQLTGQGNEPLPSAESFFTGWFESHGHQDVVVDEQGVGVSGNATRLSASIYGSQEQSHSAMVELEFRIRLPDGREIVEYVAGLGESKDQAISDTMANFTLTTFHVIYKAFINDDDPHMTSESLTINGRPRELIMGDLYMRGLAASKEVDLGAMRPQIESVLKAAPLSPDLHWIKIVYFRQDNEPTTVSVTVDNQEDTALTEAVTRLAWPESEFYMAKQFIVVK